MTSKINVSLLIICQDVSSKDFERLLSYMYHGEVSVPQAELLSLISAAKSLGIRGLVEDVGTEGEDAEDTQEKTVTDVKRKDMKGEKRFGDFCDSEKLFIKRSKQSFQNSKASFVQKSWPKSETIKTPTSKDDPTEETIPLRAHEKGVAQGTEDGKTVDEKKVGKDIEHKAKENEDSENEPKIGTKCLTNFFEVNVKQEEEEQPGEDNSSTETPGIVYICTGLKTTVVSLKS